jgi:hypothetical protein
MTEKTPGDLKNLGNRYAGQRRYDDAIRCYLEALNQDPYYIPAWHNLGVLYHHLGDEKASKCFATEKAIESRQKQIQAVDIDTKRRTATAKPVTPNRPSPWYVAQAPSKRNPMPGRICSLGIGIGLVIVVLGLKYSGFFARGNNFSVPGAVIGILILGVLVSLVSFLALNRLRYGHWCIISPVYSWMLKDPDEPQSHKFLIIGILGIGLLMIPVALYLLLYRAGVNPYGTSDTGLALIALIIVESDGTFTPSYEQLQVRQSGKKKLTYYAGFFGVGLVLVTLKSVGVIQDPSVYGVLIAIWLIACACIFFIYPRFFAGRRW